MRLIDVDENWCIHYTAPKRLSEKSYCQGVEDAMKFVKEQIPTVDAEPVRHGKWLMVERLVPCLDFDEETETFFENGKYKKHEFQTCSVCKKEPIRDNYGYLDWKYCPYCGTKMDLDGEG